MILHTIFTRGSLIVAQFTESDEDYSQLAKKKIFQIKDGSQHFEENDIHFYGRGEKEIKILILAQESNDQAESLLQKILDEYNKIQDVDGNQGKQLTDCIANLVRQKKKVIQDLTDQQKPQQEIIMPPIGQTRKPPPSSSNFYRNTAISVITVIIIVYTSLHFIIV
ncbi:hypothetical protein pb186bvf_015701 [Paramecium bursaria]